MTDHKWMIDVLADLEMYAASKELSSLKCLLGKARSNVETEINGSAIAKERMLDLSSFGRTH
ncbi:hypothetical protein [uncultured Roseovarius sp.]|uniref:hypothetical protein n=1 Tax=uncultured Roseovarius sp. TaxID=293344 RepID=UPI00261E6750|nr:hypothetical protein [uncultured Roseovarius sp.]